MLADLLGEQDLRLSPDQEEALHHFSLFEQDEMPRSTYVLTGSAGTGKTFMIRIMARLLRKQGYKVILLAPTGRAAKVITRRTRWPAYTIHHHIYAPQDSSIGAVRFELKANKEPEKTAYIVDEASMIGNKGDSSQSRGLLHDLLQYVFGTNEQRKLILVGDPVQLPPIGHTESPALDPDYLYRNARVNLYQMPLTDVKRQMLDSGVLENAVLIRETYLADGDVQALQLIQSRDVMVLEQAYEAVETYLGYYEDGNLDRTIFITYSNYRATKVNEALRHHLHETQELLVPSDLLMVVRNNYFWGDQKRLPFLANGEMGTVREVFDDTFEEAYGFKWVNAALEFEDSQGEVFLLECKLVLDLLQSKQAQLTDEQLYSIYRQRQAAYLDESPAKAALLLSSDPYINALQVKYGYWVTGHKAQGGQWENVIVGFEPDYGNDLKAYIRWTYTVLTRAEARVFLLNCPFVGY